MNKMRSAFRSRKRNLRNNMVYGIQQSRGVIGAHFVRTAQKARRSPHCNKGDVNKEDLWNK